MSFSPIAYTIPNYRDFKNYWLKSYEPGTTTPKAMALNGEAQVVKIELNKDGFPASSGGALVIPYIDGAYDLWAFPTEAEADANDTTNAERLADDVVAGISPDSLVISPYTLSEAVALADAAVGQIVLITDRANALFEYVAPTTNNGMDLIEASGSLLTLSLMIDDKVNIVHIGASADKADNSQYLNRAMEIAASTTVRKAVYAPQGEYKYSETWVWKTEVPVFGDGKKNTVFLWEGSSTDWATKVDLGGVYDASYSDFAVRGPLGTATKRLLDLREIRYSKFDNVISADGLVTAITNNSWGNEYVHCSFVPRLTSTTGDKSGTVCFWMETGQVTNATSFRHCRFQFADVGILCKSGGRDIGVTSANIFESLNTSIQIQDKFVHTFNVIGNYFEETAIVPVNLRRDGMSGFVNGLTVKDNYMICNASEVAVFRLTGTDSQNLSSVVIENNTVEFAAANQEPTSGLFLDVENGSENCILTYNQSHIVSPFDNTEAYKHYDENAVDLQTFSTNVPFELTYAQDDSGGKFGPLLNDLLVGIPNNGMMRVVGTATSPTQVAESSQVVATMPASANTGLSFTTAFSAVRGEQSPQLTIRSGNDISVTNVDSGNVAHIDFTYTMQKGRFIKNTVE